MTSSRKSWMCCCSYESFIEQHSGGEMNIAEIEKYHDDTCKYGSERCFNSLTKIFKENKGVSFIDKETPINPDSPFGFELRHGKVFLSHKIGKDTHYIIFYKNKKDENGNIYKKYFDITCQGNKCDNAIPMSLSSRKNNKYLCEKCLSCEDVSSQDVSNKEVKYVERIKIPYDDKFIKELIKEFIE